MRFWAWICRVLGRAQEHSQRWPAGTRIELTTQSGEQPFGYLLTHPAGTKERLLLELQSSYDQGQPARGRSIGSTIGRKLLGALPSCVSSMATKGLVQLVFRSGAAQVASKLAISPATLAPIAVPAVVWQVIHTIFTVYELSKINYRLDVLQRGIEKLVLHNQARVFGQMGAAMKVLRELIEQHEMLGRFTEDMRHRLVIASRDTDASLYELEFKIRDARARGESLRRAIQEKGKGKALKMLEQYMLENADYVADARLHIMACQAALIASQVWIRHDLEHNPEYASHRCEAVQGQLKDLDHAVAQLELLEDFREDAERVHTRMGHIQNWWHKDRMARICELAGRARMAGASKAEGKPETKNECGGEAAPSLFIWRSDKGELVCMVMDNPPLRLNETVEKRAVKPRKARAAFDGGSVREALESR